jgi:hypothetical protein
MRVHSEDMAGTIKSSCRSMELISLHVPKCAGTSLRHALTKAYGEEGIFFDNEDRLLDPASRVNVDRKNFLCDFKGKMRTVLNGKRVVHGHFCMTKYEGIAGPRVTILRDPVDRLISHYLFWGHLEPHGHSLHDRFLAEKPTVVEFARWPGLRDFYRGVLFRDVDMRAFDLIGNVERMGETIAKMEKLIGRRLRFEKKNDNQCEHCRLKRAEILESTKVLSELRSILADDIAFYQRYAIS